MIKFILKVRHDRGVVRIHTVATDAAAAKRQVMAAERCPERAITEVRCVDAEGFELVLNDPAQRVVQIPGRAGTRRTINHGGTTVPFKVQTVGERWRRVYRVKGGTTYVMHDGVRNVVQLPEAS